jgi:hypothetical protein
MCCAACVVVVLQATWQVITAPRDHLKQTTYNVTAVSFTPAELAEAIRCVAGGQPGAGRIAGALCSPATAMLGSWCCSLCNHL